MNSQRSRDPLSSTGDFGELLKSRVEALRQKPAQAQAMVCAECGSPLSETSQFCWMCGATRETGTTTSAPADRAAGYKVLLPSAVPVEPVSSHQAPPDTVADSSVDAPAVAEEPVVMPPTSEPELFSQIYGRDRQPLDTEEEEEERRKFDYRLIAVPILVALIIFLAYQQRRSAKDFFAMMREIVAEQIAQLWPSEKEQARPARRIAEPAKTVTVKKHVPPKPAQRRSPEVARISSWGSVPLRVRVEGQPGPQVAPAIARVAQPTPFQRAIAVGITGAMFSIPVPPAPMRIQIAPTESLSLLLRQIPPVYPAAAREAKIQGSVVLKAVIRKDGNVGELSLVSGHPMLVQAAMDAVKQWVYRPYYRNGEPMDVETLVVVEFSLASERVAVGGGL